MFTLCLKDSANTPTEVKFPLIFAEYFVLSAGIRIQPIVDCRHLFLNFILEEV